MMGDGIRDVNAPKGRNQGPLNSPVPAYSAASAGAASSTAFKTLGGDMG